MRESPQHLGPELNRKKEDAAGRHANPVPDSHRPCQSRSARSILTALPCHPGESRRMRRALSASGNPGHGGSSQRTARQERARCPSHQLYLSRSIRKPLAPGISAGRAGKCVGHRNGTSGLESIERQSTTYQRKRRWCSTKRLKENSGPQVGQHTSSTIIKCRRHLID